MKPLNESDESPLVSIIIVTWNCRDYALKCLDTIYLNKGVPFEVIVRDNGSNDGTVQAIREAYPQVCLISDGNNVGFAAANNEAIRQATGRYLLLLNPDTQLPEGTLAAFISGIERYDYPVMIVPTLLNSDGTIQPSRHTFPTPGALLRKFVRQWTGMTLDPKRVDWAIGACWLLPLALFHNVGPLDERTFMYGEDLDYCWQVWQANYQIWWVPEVTVVHLGNISGQKMWGERRLIKAYGGLIFFWRKQLNWPYRIFTVILWWFYLAIAAGFSLFGKRKARWNITWQWLAFTRACLTPHNWQLRS